MLNNYISGGPLYSWNGIMQGEFINKHGRILLNEMHMGFQYWGVMGRRAEFKLIQVRMVYFLL